MSDCIMKHRHESMVFEKYAVRVWKEGDVTAQRHVNIKIGNGH
jgi:hypothetical protein